MNVESTSNPYASSAAIEDDMPLRISWSGLICFLLAVFGSSLLSIMLLQSYLWDSSFQLYDLDNHSYSIALMVSSGYSVAALVSFFVGRVLNQRIATTFAMGLIALTAFAYFAMNSWPIAVLYIYYDLSKFSLPLRSSE